MRTLGFAFFSLALVACGSSAPPPAEKPAPPAPTAQPAEAEQKDDPTSMRASFDASCKQRNDPEACGKYALMAARGLGGDRDDKSAVVAAKTGCSDGSGLACTLLGLFFRDGRGIPQSDAKAKEAFHRACELKNADGCRGEREMSDADPPATAPKSSMSMSASSMTVDGTSFSSLSCDLGGGGGLLGPIAIAKGISVQKSALDACVKKPTETPLEVTSAGGTFTKVKASGPDAKVNACVEKALKGKQAAIPGTCTMMVQHGH